MVTFFKTSGLFQPDRVKEDETSYDMRPIMSAMIGCVAFFVGLGNNKEDKYRLTLCLEMKFL